jgi:hypothetical protein
VEHLLDHVGVVFDAEEAKHSSHGPLRVEHQLFVLQAQTLIVLVSEGSMAQVFSGSCAPARHEVSGLSAA